MELRSFFVATFVTGLGIVACQAKYSDADFGAPRGGGASSSGGSTPSSGGSSGSGGSGGSGACREAECADQMATRGLLGVCVEGTCEAMGCLEGYEDCHSDVDGCETHIAADRTTCGDCDTHCGPEAACIAAACTPYSLAFRVVSYTEGVSLDPLVAPADEGVFVGYRFDRDLHLDDQGHTFEVEFAPSRDASLSRFDVDGNLNFALSIKSSGLVELRDVSSSRQGVAATGYFRSGGGGPLELETVDKGFVTLNPADPFDEKDEGFVHAVDQEGKHRFTVMIRGGGDVRIYSSTADDQGNVYVLGLFHDTAPSPLTVGASEVDVGDLEWGGFIVKILSNGALGWGLVIELEDPFDHFLHSGSLAVDGAGRLYYSVASSGSMSVGALTSTSTGSTPRLLALEPDGSPAYLRTYSSIAANTDSAHAVVGPDNRLFYVVSVSNTQSAIGEHPLEQRPYLIELDPDTGDPLVDPDDASRVQIHPLSNGYELTRATYGNGEIVVVGQTRLTATVQGELDLGGGPQSYDHAALTRNVVIVGVDLDGAFRWGRHYGSAPHEQPPSVAVNASGVFVSCRFTESMTIDETDVEFTADKGNQYVLRFAAE